MNDKLCEHLKKYVESGEMETSGLYSDICIDCYEIKNGIDVFCVMYSPINWERD